MLFLDIEETLNRQDDEVRSVTDEIDAMETELQQLILKLSHLDPQSITCTQ